MQQHLMPPLPSSFPVPGSRTARHDYRRARRLARALALEECQGVFLDTRPKSAAQYRWGWYYPLICLGLFVLSVVLRLVTPTSLSDPVTALLIFSCLLLPYALIALGVTAFRRTLFHCEQIHLYANGVVAIDARGRRQGARFDQLFDFRRGEHEHNVRYGRIHWDTIRAAVTNTRAGQRPTLKITPHLPDGVEICALIERNYTTFWLPRFRERLQAGEVLDFDALLLHRDWLGKTTPGRRRFSASFPLPPLPTDSPSVAAGTARGLITQTDAGAPVEWLRRTDIKSIRTDDRFLLIRTREPVHRDQQGRADRLWFQLDTLGLKDAAILKELVSV